MRFKNKVCLFTLFFLVLSLSAVFAQQVKENTLNVSQDRDLKQRLIRNYDPATVEIVSGVVEAVEVLPPARGRTGGVHLQLKTDKGVIPVHMGPQWYVNSQNVKIEKGDKVEVKGSRISIDKETFMVAAEVKKADAILKLRDEDGYPLWSRGRKK
ncbi:MAG: hypothetical protein N3A59_00840 [Thermodesulfovibrionales bacterium]|nr:hypothetical protein [Thermodesulfovibrionales bacterium]